ncbi:MAG: TIGR02996 domain-containing protein [Kofleriaceae bacterium]
MGRYELGTESFSIEQHEASLAITEGGVDRVEKFATAADAYRRFTILTNQKLRAGWKLVPAVEAPTAAAPVVFDARNPELEAALLEDPFDRDAWQIYGDWLLQQGDPRGEYIAARIATLDHPHDAMARDRLRTCETKYGAKFRGTLSGELGWGFVDSLELGRMSIADFTSPEARFVTRIVFHGKCNAQLKKLGKHFPATVRAFELRANTDVESLDPIAATLPRLRELVLHASSPESCFRSLSKHAFPQLRSFHVQGGIPERAPMLRSVGLVAMPALRELRLEIGVAAETCAAIAQASYVPHLLVLSVPFIDDEGARELVKHARRFQALTRLEVDGSALDPDVRAALVHEFGVVDDVGRRYRPMEE